MNSTRAANSIYSDFKLISNAFPGGFTYDVGQESAADVQAAFAASRNAGGPLVLLRRYAQGMICEMHEVN